MSREAPTADEIAEEVGNAQERLRSLDPEAFAIVDRWTNAILKALVTNTAERDSLRAKVEELVKWRLEYDLPIPCSSLSDEEKEPIPD